MEVNFWNVTLSVGTGLLVGWRVQRLVSARTISNLSKWITWNYKLVLVVPKHSESRLPVSRIAEHCASASILAYRTSVRQTPISCFIWSLTGQPKVVLKVPESELESIRQQASRQLLCTTLIRHDSTESTVLAVGPAPNSILNQITGHLKLY